ncbi:MAG TPA: hypothetical protein VI895_04525 [Bdellovibrionota bacterium]|nr:hypothetical protein [Bdellovibrionota bacterium]
MPKKRVQMSRVLRRGQEDDGMFDLRFWQRVGPEGIFAAAWEMVKEVQFFKGQNAGESRLQRSVTQIIRRGR